MLKRKAAARHSQSARVQGRAAAEGFSRRRRAPTGSDQSKGEFLTKTKISHKPNRQKQNNWICVSELCIENTQSILHTHSIVYSLYTFEYTTTIQHSNTQLKSDAQLIFQYTTKIDTQLKSNTQLKSYTQLKCNTKPKTIQN